MKERALIIILFVAFLVALEIYHNGTEAPLQRETIDSTRYIEIVKEGEGRIYPVTMSALPVQHGDMLEYLDDGTLSKGSMEGGKKILFGMTIDINRATVNDLIAIPGVGLKTAGNIMNFRKKFGNFETVNDLLKVKGIGEKKLSRMKVYVKV